MTTKLKVTGMTCGHCEARVKKALAKVSGVTEVTQVDHGQNQVIVEGNATTASLVAAIKEQGFEAEAIA